MELYEALNATQVWILKTKEISSPAHIHHSPWRLHISLRKNRDGVCVYVNNRWCGDVYVVEKHCLANLEPLMVKYRPFYLPKEFGATIACCFNPPEVDHMTVLKILHDAISRPETAHPDAVFIVAGNFNHCNLRNILPMFHQHVYLPTRKNNILDQVYSNVKDIHRAMPQPHLYSQTTSECSSTQPTHNSSKPPSK